MIRDARVLRAGFVPREVEHRDAEVNHLSSVLKPITNGEPADTAIVTDPVGQGRPASRNSSRNAYVKRSSTSRPPTSTAGATTPDFGRSTRSSTTSTRPSTFTGSRHPVTTSASKRASGSAWSIKSEFQSHIQGNSGGGISNVVEGSHLPRLYRSYVETWKEVVCLYWLHVRWLGQRSNRQTVAGS